MIFGDMLYKKRNILVSILKIDELKNDCKIVLNLCKQITVSVCATIADSISGSFKVLFLRNMYLVDNKIINDEN